MRIDCIGDLPQAALHDIEELRGCQRKVDKGFLVNSVLKTYSTFSGDVPVRFVEIGVKFAKTALMIVKLARLLVRQCDYVGVDISPAAGDKFKKRFPEKSGPHPAKIHIMPAHDAAPLVQDDCAAWLFIDACHCYDCAYEDIHDWAAKVRRDGGLLLFHDTALWQNANPVRPCPQRGGVSMGKYGVLPAIRDSAAFLRGLGFAEIGGCANDAEAAQSPAAGMMLFRRTQPCDEVPR